MLALLVLSTCPAAEAEVDPTIKMICPVGKKNKAQQRLRDVLSRIAKGESPNTVIEKGKTALHLASEAQQYLAAAWLIAKGADPMATDDSGHRFYDYIEPMKLRDILEFTCCKKKVKLDKEDVLYMMRDANDEGKSTSLFIVILPPRYLAFFVAFAVNSGFDVNMKDENGRKWPIRKDMEITYSRLLLALGWEPESPTPEDLLHYAVLRDDVKAVKKMLKKNANLVKSEGNALLPRVQSSAMLKVFLEAGANINPPPVGPSENPLTQYGLMYGANKTTIAALLKAGAGIPYHSDTGNTVLHIIALASHVENDILDLYVKHGANVNQPNNSGGETPLHLACRAGNYPTVAALLAAGADATLRNSNGQTPEQVIGQSFPTPPPHILDRTKKALLTPRAKK